MSCPVRNLDLCQIRNIFVYPMGELNNLMYVAKFSFLQPVPTNRSDQCNPFQMHVEFEELKRLRNIRSQRNKASSEAEIIVSIPGVNCVLNYQVGLFWHLGENRLDVHYSLIYRNSHILKKFTHLQKFIYT